MLKKFFMLLGLTFFISACGQTGNLYLPPPADSSKSVASHAH